MRPGSHASKSHVSTWLAFGAFYVALTAVYARPLLAMIGSALPNDAGDPALNAWILWWNAHAVPFTDAWWNAPAFFPARGAFAFSETLLGLVPLTTPLQWAGLGAVSAYNAAFLVSFPASALAAHALAYRLGGRHDAALLAGLSFGFSPYRVAQLPHIQLQWAFWMPLCLLALHHYVESKRGRYLAMAGVCWTMNAFACGYYFVFFAVLVALWMIWFLRSRREWVSVSATLAAASLPVVPLLAGYARYLGAIGASRGRGEIETFSADLSAVWAVSPGVWLPAHWTFAPRPEGELYPGVVIMVLAVVGIVTAWRRAPRPWRPEPRTGALVTGLVALGVASIVWMTGGISASIAGIPISVTRPHRLVGIGVALVTLSFLADRRFKGSWRRRSVFAFYVIAAAVMFAFAIGPVGRAFGERFMDKAPYYWLMQLPGGESLRVPARFAMLFMLCLGQAAALGFRRATAGGARTPLVAALACAVVADGWVADFPVAPVRTEIDLRNLPKSAAVLELPMRDLYDDTAAMLRGTTHGRPVVNGFSGFSTPHYGALQTGIEAADPSVFDALREVTPLLVIVNRANDGDGKYLNLVRSVPDARLEFDTSIGPVYTMDRVSPPARPAPTPVIPVVSIEATDNASDAPAMVDRDFETRWATSRPQTPGPEIRLRVDQAVELARIEMDLAGLERTYPRRLRVSVQKYDEPMRQVWEGGVAGATIRAALADWRRTTVPIDLPPSTIGNRIVLTLVGSDREEPWSIAELRVYGTLPSPTRP